MTNVESISFPDMKLKERLEIFLKSTNKKKSPCIMEAIKEYLDKRGY